MNVKIDPWSSTNIEDYSKLFEEFGIMPFDDLYSRIEAIAVMSMCLML